MNVRAKKTICEVHYIGLCFSVEKPEKEEGTVPSSGQVLEEKHSSRITFSLTKLKAMSAVGYSGRPDGLSSQ